jgi:glycosyltransferase involved in cell wall biosynthesis
MSSVDVVVPCYNYAKFLPGCIQSILSQRDVDVRVLIVNDASTDNTTEVAAGLAASDHRVSVLHHEKNQGLVKTANDGVIDWACADYTVLLSADDALTPGSIARSVQVMDAHPDVGMTYGMALVVADESGMTSIEDVKNPLYRIIPGPEFLKRNCEYGNGVASPTSLVRTSIQKRVGGYHPDFPHTCDVEMWMRIATRCPIAVLGSIQAYYRWHGNNMSKAYIYRPTSDLADQLTTVDEVLTKWGAAIPEFAGWVRDMKYRFSEEACWMAGRAVEWGDSAASKDCIAFAAKNNPSLWLLTPWWKYQAKRLLGGFFAKRIRRMLHPKTAESPEPFTIYAPFKHGETFGWWPETQQ